MKFPRTITIKPTLESTTGKIIEDEGGDESDIDVLEKAYVSGYDSTTEEFESWEDMEERYPGYEPVEPEDIECYKKYLENKDMEKRYPGINL